MPSCTLALCACVVLLCSGVYLSAAARAPGSYAQRAVLRTSDGFFVSLGDQDSADLSEWQFDKRTTNVCVIGIWLLYDLVNYELSSDSNLEFAMGQQYCGALEEAPGQISSVRLVGNRADWTQSTLTVYAETYFQGAQHYMEMDSPSFNISNVASLAITGAAEVDRWTLYAQPDYTQLLACIFPVESPDFPPYSPGMLPDIEILGPIQSAKIGCPFVDEVSASKAGVKMIGIPARLP